MSAARLRESASVLTIAAEGATTAPWSATHDRDDDAYYNSRVFGPGKDDWVSECRPGRPGERDATYIALMNPTLGTALAELLNGMADRVAEIDDSAGGFRAQRSTISANVVGYDNALAVADAILGPVTS